MYRDINHLPEYTGPFRDVIPDYLHFRVAQGMKHSNRLAQSLRAMDDFFKEAGINTPSITRETYEAFTERRPNEKPGTTENRRSLIRPFARYLENVGYENIYTGYDDRRLLKSNYTPYIYSKEEIRDIFTILKNESSLNPSVQICTFRIAMLMYYCCGFRKSELIFLHVKDVDINSGKITIHDGKNKVTRMVVASDSLLSEIRSYVKDYLADADPDDYFLYPIRKRKTVDHYIYNGLNELFLKAGITPRKDGPRPRLHDFRHTFCVRTLEQMEAKGFDLYSSLPLLSVYLGHSHVTHTEYYLRMLNEHFDLIISKAEEYSPGLYSADESEV